MYRQLRVSLTESLFTHGHKHRFKRPNDKNVYSIYLVNGLIKITSRQGKCYDALTWDELLHCWLEKRNGYE